MPQIDLAKESVGGYALAANDDFFASRENLVKDAEAIWDEHRYVPTGKWMDGWETRRRREPGYDWCVVRLGVPGVVEEVVVDTAHFKGNYPEQASVEGCVAPHNAKVEQLEKWVELVPRSDLKGDHKNAFKVDCPYKFTHIRLNIFPDGGVARLRVMGQPVPHWMRPAPLKQPLDLAAMVNGAFVEEASDMFFGNRNNLILPGPSRQMNEGWETRRRRDDGNDWATVRLATTGTVDVIELDTSHFKGNYPAAAKVEATADFDSASWTELLPRQQTLPHTLHTFQEQLRAHGPIGGAKLHIYPCGGMARMRMWGHPDRDGLVEARLKWLNSLMPEALEAELLTCCGSTTWAKKMEKLRPFQSEEDLREKSNRAWSEVDQDDWMEAFRSHPRIGEKKAETERARSAAWSAQEQSRAHVTTKEEQARLVDGNKAYEEKFGFIFIICATGKRTDAVLGSLEQRLENDRETELKNAAEEQSKITALRLEKLLTT